VGIERRVAADSLVGIERRVAADPLLDIERRVAADPLLDIEGVPPTMGIGARDALGRP
jgi:hypothetical protein